MYIIQCVGYFTYDFLQSMCSFFNHKLSLRINKKKKNIIPTEYLTNVVKDIFTWEKLVILNIKIVFSQIPSNISK